MLPPTPPHPLCISDASCSHPSLVHLQCSHPPPHASLTPHALTPCLSFLALQPLLQNLSGVHKLNILLRASLCTKHFQASPADPLWGKQILRALCSFKTYSNFMILHCIVLYGRRTKSWSVSNVSNNFVFKTHAGKFWVFGDQGDPKPGRAPPTHHSLPVTEMQGPAGTLARKPLHKGGRGSLKKA